MKKALILCGPTASGKTRLSIYISKILNCEIINADSRQIYKHISIGTAKPTKDELSQVKHNFIDIVYPDEHYDAGMFGIQGREKIEEIFQSGKTPLIVGGSGLYIRSLIDGLFEGPTRDENLRLELEERISREGLDSLFKELTRVDPEAAKGLDPSKSHRIIRALEVYYLTGNAITKLREQNKISIDFIPVIFGLNWDRELLYSRVNKRSEEMIFDGLIEETCNLFSLGYNEKLKSLQTVGYKECLDYLFGKIKYNEMIELIKQNTRHYVKRQMTWFNRDKRIKWININPESDFGNIAEIIYNNFKNSVDL